MSKEIKKETLKEVITNLADSIDMSDLELYRIELDSKISVFELFFDHYFRKYEGMTYSHDKSIYVSKKINEYLMTGNNARLQETYREYQSRGNDIGGITELDRVCYWCPTTIKTSEEATAIFFHYLCMDISYFEKRKAENNNANTTN